MNNPYSSTKVFHHQDRLSLLSRGGHPFPVHVHLVPTNVCNQRCNFCAYRAEGYSSNESFNCRESIPQEKLLDLVRDFSTVGVRAVEVTGGGEPTCHPSFIRLCQDTLDRGLDLGVVTNGSLWTPAHVKATREAKWVRFSIDAGLPETYASIRHVAQSIHASVRNAVTAQAYEKSPDQVVGVAFTVTRDNWTEVIEATKNAREDGADNIRISAVFQNDDAHYFDSFVNEASVLCHHAEELATDEFRVFNLFSDRLSDLQQRSPYYQTCHVQRLCTYIGADQNVYRCCVLAYNHLGLLGSIRDKMFSELWQDARPALDEFDAHRCSRCMFNAKNATIRSALNPAHINFI